MRQTLDSDEQRGKNTTIQYFAFFTLTDVSIAGVTVFPVAMYATFAQMHNTAEVDYGCFHVIHAADISHML